MPARRRWAARSTAVLEHLARRAPHDGFRRRNRCRKSRLIAAALRKRQRSTSSTRATSRSASASSRHAGCTCWHRRRRRSYGDAALIDETLEPFDPSAIDGGRHRRHRHPHRQRASRLRNRDGGARGRRLRRLRRHPRHALSRTKRTSSAARHAVVTGDGEHAWPRRFATARPGTPQRALRRRPGRGRDVPARPLGSAAAGALHVGLGADRSRLPEALLVLLGLADRRPEAAAAARRRA